ncbi:DUF2182 domain-containing protein [Saccharopolyspora mangrovi]|uniref:DUF2182 domain-containing protein n=1 Tax=Saccharopolyspora mangrovi TaxID=3082379 RepID=A0ABU6AE46_9PSEU|nr:DUF2182 domain-containing protein [Saccharopolyspora sp. S2-29]MEB3369805.1 DUF2182 domain-containing protein [Saccharopolyspora sp. S2-29]
MTRTVQARGIPSLRSWSGVEVALAAVLLALAGISWLLSAVLGMPEMRMGLLTGTGQAEMSGGPAPFALFLAVWVVMMAAMMLPAITPFTIGVSRLVRARRKRGVLPSLTLGYLLVWTAAGVAAWAILRGFDAIDHSGTSVRVGAVVLLVAGAYEFSPLKRWCLVRCRSPLALVVKHGDTVVRGRLGLGALRVGVHHGGYCLGCCWALMVVLLAVGAMNLLWMAVLAAVIAMEKVLPRAEIVSSALGAVLIGAGVVLLIAPGLLAPMA